MKSPDFINLLKSQGYKLTKVRIQLIKLLSETQKPVSAGELIQLLGQTGHQVNKSTVYRELDFLKSQHILTEIQFNEDKKRYEISSTHHHHLICLNCDGVEDVGVE